MNILDILNEETSPLQLTLSDYSKDTKNPAVITHPSSEEELPKFLARCEALAASGHLGIRAVTNEAITKGPALEEMSRLAEALVHGLADQFGISGHIRVTHGKDQRLYVGTSPTLPNAAALVESLGLTVAVAKSMQRFLAEKEEKKAARAQAMAELAEALA